MLYHLFGILFHRLHIHITAFLPVQSLQWKETYHVPLSLSLYAAIYLTPFLSYLQAVALLIKILTAYLSGNRHISLSLQILIQLTDNLVGVGLGYHKHCHNILNIVKIFFSIRHSPPFPGCIGMYIKFAVANMVAYFSKSSYGLGWCIL